MASDTFPRRFLPPGATLEEWPQIEPFFDQLDQRPIDTPGALQRWLEDVSELLAAVDEVGTERYVRMTCQTDDDARKAAYLAYVEHIEPPVKERRQRLQERYLQCPQACELDGRRYGVLDRRWRAAVELFRIENVPIQAEEAKLAQRYQEVCGRMTVEFDGQERTLPQLAPYAERVERDVRQQAWEAESARRLADVGPIEDLFDEMLQLRGQMARNADCADYRDYAFKRYQRFDYTPADCEAFHAAVERAVVPVLRQLHEQRRAALGVEQLRPWDLAVDVQGRAPLRPFQTVDELCERSQRVLAGVHPDLGEQFALMRREGWLDLDSRKGKAPGGYQANFEAARRPFIFMNAVGVHGDVLTLMHEAGHAFHALAARHDPLVDYRSSPIEFAEVASMSMELLTLDHLEAFYTADELARVRRRQLERCVTILPWVAIIDAFQHFLYTQPEHDRATRRAQWLALLDRFGGLVEYGEHGEARAFAWQKQLHLFEVPFYYIEYAIAQLGALQVWRNARQDPTRALQQYRDALALGGSQPLPELFARAGARFDFSYDTLAPLMDMLQAELAALPQ